MFVTIGFSVYLLSTYPPEWLSEKVSLVYLFFIIIILLSFITVRITASNQFEITPLDYLVVIMTVIVSVVPGIEHGASSLVWLVLQMVIMFYACELIIQNMTSQFNSRYWCCRVGIGSDSISRVGLILLVSVMSHQCAIAQFCTTKTSKTSII